VTAKDASDYRGAYVTSSLKSILAVLILTAAYTAPTIADDWDNALSAYKRGDFATAMHFFRPVAEQGNPSAQYVLGIIYSTDKPVDYIEAEKWFRKSAEQGNGGAQISLGSMYLSGQGVPQDFTEAAHWLTRAAQQDEAIAQLNLGVMYASGQGVRLDEVVAARWIRLAAEQGNSLAQARLAVMYEQGRGVPQDYVQAHLWANLAAARSTKVPTETRDKLFRFRDSLADKMNQDQVAEAQRLARDWKPRERQE
jgi:TPR repeat protein